MSGIESINRTVDFVSLRSGTMPTVTYSGNGKSFVLEPKEIAARKKAVCQYFSKESTPGILLRVLKWLVK